MVETEPVQVWQPAEGELRKALAWFALRPVTRFGEVSGFASVLVGPLVGLAQPRISIGPGANGLLFALTNAPMSTVDLRAKIRLLMASGDLPLGSPLVETTVPGQTIRVTRIVLGQSHTGPCLICGEADATLAYTYSDQRIVHLHTACDALWEQERGAC